MYRGHGDWRSELLFFYRAQLFFLTLDEQFGRGTFIAPLM